jgi:Flp pilus assembly protein CpaB
VTTAVHALAPPEPATDRVPVAAHDLAAGHVVQAGDVVTVAWPRDRRPDGVLVTPVGRVLVTAVRRGEPVTDVRVTGPGLLTGQPAGTVAVAVRLSDAAATALLAPGRRIDLLGGPVADPAAPAEATSADLLAGDVLVLAAPGRSGADLAAGAADQQDDGLPADALGASAGLPADGSGGSGSGIVVVAADHETAARLAAAVGTRSITAVLTG